MTNTCVFHGGFIHPLFTTKVLTQLYLKDEKLYPYFFFFSGVLGGLAAPATVTVLVFTASHYSLQRCDQKPLTH